MAEDPKNTGDVDSTSGDASELTSAPTEAEASDSDGSDNQLKWDFSTGNDAVIIARGFPSNYDLNYIVWIRVDPDPDVEEVQDIVSLASGDESLIEEINLEQPPKKLRETLKDTRIELQLDGSGIDNQVVQDKYRKLFMDHQFTNELFDGFRDDDVDTVVERLKKAGRDKVFPGSEINQDVEIMRWDPDSSEPSTPDSNVEEADNLKELARKSDGSTRMLTVSPKIRPFLGTELGKLQPGDVFEVRVIGESAMRLRSEFIDTSSSDDKPYSKPLEARLISLEQGEVPQEIRYLVELADDVYGIGSTARDARVFYNEQLVRANEPPLLYSLRIVLFACSIFLLIALVMLFIVL